jgi:Uma2 family endonuclease
MIHGTSTSKRDITVKYDLYQRHGVKEYWLLYPNEKLLQLYRLGNDGRYGAPQAFGPDDVVAVHLLGELEIDLTKVLRE